MKRIIGPVVLVCLVACLITPRLVGQGSIPVQEQSSKTNDTKTAGVDLDGRQVYPLDEAIDKGVVLVFVDVECPISNRYAPEIQRLQAKFTEKGVRFWLVYPDPHLSADAIRKHVEQYRYRIGILRDPEHALVHRAQVRVTPETAVFGSRGQLVYHGRIDDRYVQLGLERPQATRNDLAEILEAVVNGKALQPSSTKALGCSIPEAR